MPDGTPKIELYERRFGNIAIEKGYITSADLIKALDIQVQEELDEGKRPLIGQIMLELNVMSLKQIDDVLSELFKKEKE
jgi:hypothetical protein